MIIYDLILFLVSFLEKVAALFNKKIALRVNGQKNMYDRIAQTFSKNDSVIWFHAASLGEFEEGRPVIEKIRQEHPEYKLLLTFFSPSGYEVRKNYKGADLVLYLPLDTPCKARKFVQTIRPSIAVFIKYEFWFNYINELTQIGSRIFCISGRFIPDSEYFHWYGYLYRKAFAKFEHFFVQDERSVALLKSIGIEQVTQAGDPRFDRVYDISQSEWNDAVIERFVHHQKPIFVAGSTSANDHKLIIDLVNNHSNNRFIITPHELDESLYQTLENEIKGEVLRYTKCGETTDFSNTQVLIIDIVGILAYIYRYGDMGYIGAGFEKGIHSVIEASVYGLPCAFGPNIFKNRPAIEMCGLKLCRAVTTPEDLNEWYDELLSNNDFLELQQKQVMDYTLRNKGATEIILKNIFK